MTILYTTEPFNPYKKVFQLDSKHLLIITSPSFIDLLHRTATSKEMKARWLAFTSGSAAVLECFLGLWRLDVSVGSAGSMLLSPFSHDIQQALSRREEQGQIKQVNDLPLAGLYSVRLISEHSGAAF